MALAGQNSGYFFIVNPVTGEIEHTATHLRSSCQFSDRVDPHLDFEVAHGAAAPDDSDQSDIVLAAIEYDLLDKTSQQRFALSIRGCRILPNMREAPGEALSARRCRVVRFVSLGQIGQPSGKCRFSP
jgi:hypothetical protein